MARVLVTGAAGFLGSHLSDRLLDEGHTVLSVDNLSIGNLENLRHLRNEPRFTFEEWDICDAFDPEGGVPGKVCTREDETNWYERSLGWHEGRRTVRSRS
jgi:nucleoside-diphosphate-sugar epimerase